MGRSRHTDLSDVLREARGRLRRQAREAKWWRWLLDVDRLTINGEVIWKKDQKLNGLRVTKRK